MKNVKRVASEILNNIRVGADKKLVDGVTRKIVQEVFGIEISELKKYFSSLKGIVSQDPDGYGRTRKEITGIVEKEWIVENFGDDESLSNIEKRFDKHFSNGPGLSFSNRSMSLKVKGKQYSFEIIINSDLDI